MMVNRAFTRRELAHPDFNVDGKVMSGTSPKKPLDCDKMAQIRRLLLERVPDKEKREVWKRCKSAIHKRMHDLREEFGFLM
jgi:hypothetical protein